MYLIIGWNIAENRIIGPFITIKAALDNVETLEGQGLTHWMIVGPLPVCQEGQFSS